MQQNEHHSATYKQMAEAWKVDEASIRKAKGELGDRLIEGEHYQKDPQQNGAFAFSQTGQLLLIEALGLEVDGGQSEIGSREDVGGSPTDHTQEEQPPGEYLGRVVAQELAYPTAVSFWQHFPGAVMGHIRRMSQQPTEAELPLVRGAIQAAIAGASDPKLLSADSGEVS